MEELNLSKELSDLRQSAAGLYNRWLHEGDLKAKAIFDQALIEINSLKAKITALKDKS